jgi:hypothetical protein
MTPKRMPDAGAGAGPPRGRCRLAHNRPMDDGLGVHHDSNVIFIVLGVYVALQAAWVVRRIYKDRRDIAGDFGHMRAAWVETRADFVRLRGAYRAERATGLDRVDALTAAADDVSGTPHKRVPLVEVSTPAAAPRRSVFEVAWSLLINAVAIGGVYWVDWPVGTGLALYWVENVITGTLMVLAILVWRARRPTGDIRQPAGPEVMDVALITVFLNGGYLPFLFAILGWILPRMDGGEVFDRTSFIHGTALVGALLAVSFIRGMVRIGHTSAADMQAAVTSYVQRVVVMGLSIIGGMSMLLLFGTPRAFFAVFAVLKVLADLSRSW